jgi:hypothetical protein
MGPRSMDSGVKTDDLGTSREDRDGMPQQTEGADGDDESRSDRKCPVDLYFQDQDESWGQDGSI